MVGFADFAADCWAATYFAVGQFSLIDLPAPGSTAGTEVEASIPPTGLVAGQPSELAFPVACDGQPVNDLEPYLGARGRLVPLRERESRGAARAPPTPRPGCLDQLACRLAQRWPLPALPAIPASGRGPDRRLTERYR